MLGWVREEELSKVLAQLKRMEELLILEREARITAQAHEQSWRDHASQLRADLVEANNAAQSQRELHASQVIVMLEHIAPIDESKRFDPSDPAIAAMTPEQIRAEPASSKRGMILREKLAKAAEERLMTAKEKEERSRRLDLIVTDEERRANALDYDGTLGILKERVDVAEPVAAEA